MPSLSIKEKSFDLSSLCGHLVLSKEHICESWLKRKQNKILELPRYPKSIAIYDIRNLIGRLLPAKDDRSS